MKTARHRSRKYGEQQGGAGRVKEQLRLWAVERGRSLQNLALAGLTYEERLVSLLGEDLSFEREKTTYSRHNFHAFAAKFPPQLPALFIENLTQEGEVVLDPMAGSGTALLEAALLGRHAIGVDIDPLAYRVSTIKTMRVSPDAVLTAAHGVVRQAQRAIRDPERLRRAMAANFSTETLRFIHYWFMPGTQLELMALVEAIDRVEDARIKAFLEVALSSIIVTKSGGVSMARDLAHSRPHKDHEKIPKDAIEQFSQRVRKNLRSLAGPVPQGHVQVYRGDARHLQVGDDTVDLIVTSPPYANAIDYMRAHKFSLVWLGEPITALSELRSTYIGTEKTGAHPLQSFGKVSREVLTEIMRRDEKKARVMSMYLRDMSLVFSEMLRVLNPGRCAVVVVGSSTMRGLDVRTHDCLAEVAASVGWRIVGMASRRIARDKRMMPMRHGDSRSTQIEQRMSQERVIGMVKP